MACIYKKYNRNTTFDLTGHNNYLTMILQLIYHAQSAKKNFSTSYPHVYRECFVRLKQIYRKIKNWLYFNYLANQRA